MKSIVKQSLLFIANIGEDVNEQDVYELFKGHPIAYVKLVKDHQTKKNQGYGFIGFRTADNAEKALAQINYSKLKTRTVRLSWYTRSPDSARNNAKCNIFFKNLPDDATAQLLHELCNQYGKVVSLNLMEDEFGVHYNSAFVLLETEEEAVKVVNECNNLVWLGKKIYAGPVEPKRERREPKFTNIVVKSLSKDLNEQQIEEIFSEFGKVTSIFLKSPSEATLNLLCEKRRKEIEGKQIAFINFEDPEVAKQMIDRVTYRDTKDEHFNSNLDKLAEIMLTIGIEERDKFRAATKFIEYCPDYTASHLVNNGELTDIAVQFKLMFAQDKTDFGELILPVNRENKLICQRAMGRKERIRTMKRLSKVIKERIKKKFAFCNLYAKNFPQEMSDEEIKALFEKFGKIYSMKIIHFDEKFNNLGILSQETKRHAFVSFFTQEEAKNCKDSLLKTQKGLYVSYFERKQDREFKKNLKFKRKEEDLKKALAQINGLMHDMGTGQIRQLPDNFVGVNSGLRLVPIDLQKMNEEERREFLGETFYGRLMQIPEFASYENLFGKVTGVLLDITASKIINALLYDNNFFLEQARETIKLLSESV